VVPASKRRRLGRPLPPAHGAVVQFGRARGRDRGQHEAVTMTITNAGIATVEQFDLRMP
jgi:hypothetical protein